MDLTYERKNAYKNADEKKLKKIENICVLAVYKLIIIWYNGIR